MAHPLISFVFGTGILTVLRADSCELGKGMRGLVETEGDGKEGLVKMRVRSFFSRAHRVHPPPTSVRFEPTSVGFHVNKPGNSFLSGGLRPLEF